MRSYRIVCVIFYNIEILWPLLLEYSCRQFYESNIVNFSFMLRAMDRTMDDVGLVLCSVRFMSLLCIFRRIKGDSDTFFPLWMFLLGIDDNWFSIPYHTSHSTSYNNFGFRWCVDRGRLSIHWESLCIYAVYFYWLLNKFRE